MLRLPFYRFGFSVYSKNNLFHVSKRNNCSAKELVVEKLDDDHEGECYSSLIY